MLAMILMTVMLKLTLILTLVTKTVYGINEMITFKVYNSDGVDITDSDEFIVQSNGDLARLTSYGLLQKCPHYTYVFTKTEAAPMKLGTNKTNQLFEAIRAIEPEVPEECTALTLHLDCDKLPVFTVTFNGG
jgi:hypothetical protein